jgi:hypothetical protein
MRTHEHRRETETRTIGFRHVFKRRAKGTDLAQMAHAGGLRSLDDGGFL